MNICRPLWWNWKADSAIVGIIASHFEYLAPGCPRPKAPSRQETTTGWTYHFPILSFISPKRYSLGRFLQISLGFEEQYSKIDSLFLGPFLGKNKHVKKHARGISWPQRCHASTFDSSNSLLPRLCFLSLSCSFVLFCATFSCTHSFHRVVLPGGPCLAANLQHCHGSEGTNFVGLDFEILWETLRFGKHHQPISQCKIYKPGY